MSKERQRKYLATNTYSAPSATSDWRDQTWKNLLLETFHSLKETADKKAGETLTHSGATLCMTVLSGNSIHTLNIGNNLAYSVLIDKQNNYHINLLNQSILHTPTAKTEADRLEDFATKEKKNIELLLPKNFKDNASTLNNRLAGLLKTTRAIGLFNYHRDGLSDEAAIVHEKIDTSNLKSAFVVTFSANLVKDIADPAEKMREIFISELGKKTPGNIAFRLAREMNPKQSQLCDKAISVLSINCNNSKKNLIKYSAIISSINNNAIAALLHKNIDQIFHEKIEQASKLLNPNHRSTLTQYTFFKQIPAEELNEELKKAIAKSSSSPMTLSK